MRSIYQGFFSHIRYGFQRRLMSSKIPKILAMSSFFLFQNFFKNEKITCESKKDYDESFEKYFTPQQKSDLSNVALISGNANPDLANSISRILQIPLLNCQIGKFADGEVRIQIFDSVRGKDVFIIQPTCNPVNDNLMELLLLISTLKRSSAKEINVVIPYYGYARQDRKNNLRVPISAADVAKLIETMGANRVICVDLHVGQIQGFFSPSIPTDNIEGAIVAVNYFKSQKLCALNNFVIISPDAGGVPRAKRFCELFQAQTKQQCSMGMIVKQRSGAGKIGSMNLIGDVNGKNVILIDDILDSAGTFKEASKLLKENGANKIFAFASHGLFSENAFENIQKSYIDQVLVTDTTKQKPEEQKSEKIIRLSIAPLLADTIHRIQSKKSLTQMYLMPNK